MMLSVVRRRSALKPPSTVVWGVGGELGEGGTCEADGGGGDGRDGSGTS